MKSLEKKRIISLLIFYVINHGLIVFFPNALFWDDWYINRVSPADILIRLDQINLPFRSLGLLHSTLIQYGPIAYKYLGFILMFIAGLLLDGIIKRTLTSIGYTYQAATSIAYIIVLLFLVLPFNSARPLLIIFPYLLSYFLFFLAWRLIDRAYFIAALLFMISFETNSMLVFYIVPIADLYLRTIKDINIKGAVHFTRRNWLLLVLPVLYFSIRQIWFKPYGLYENYNQDFGIIKIIKSPILQAANIFDVQINIGLFIIALLICIILLRKNKNILLYIPTCSIKWYLVGLFVFISACFPYWIIGRVPTFNVWSSRHQLLIPLSIAIILTTIMIRERNKYYQKSLLILFVCISMTYNLNTYIGYYVDWEKQLQLIKLFRENKVIKDGSLIIFTDESINKNYLNREYAVYEWNGILEMAFGDQKRLGIKTSEVNRYLQGGLDGYITTDFKASDFNKLKDQKAVLVTIYDTRNDTRELGFKLDRSERFLDQLFGWARPKFQIKTECVDKNSSFGYRNLSQC